MKNVTKACIDDYTAFGFPFLKIVFMTISLVPVPKQQGTLKKMISKMKMCIVCLEDYLSTCKAEENDSENPCLVKTPMATLHLMTAEAIYLNGTSFLEQIQLKEYNSADECCPNVIKKGKVLTLPTFADDQIKVKGEVCWLSRNFNHLSKGLSAGCTIQLL